MKSWYLFCVFLCVLISFSSVFGDDDADTSVEVLIQEFKSLRNRVSVLESVIEKQTEIIQVQNDRIMKFESIVKSKNFDEEDLEKSNYSPPDIENRIKQSRENNTETSPLELDQHNTPTPFIPRKVTQERISKRSVRLAAVQPIAFYAYMSHGLQNPGGHHTLIFDVTTTNEGNGYHSHLGVFMVPKSGTYFFSWTMALDPTSHHSAELAVNNQPHGVIHLRYPGGERGSVTGNLILNLNQNDEVFIRTREDYNAGPIISDNYGWTSFSGFLIE